MSDAYKMLLYESHKKSAGIAYVLWFFFGMFGGHRFYLGYSGSAVAILVLTVIFLLLTSLTGGIAGVLLLIPAVWVIVDAFLIPGMTRDYNNQIIKSLNFG